MASILIYCISAMFAILGLILFLAVFQQAHRGNSEQSFKAFCYSVIMLLIAAIIAIPASYL